MVGEGNWHWEDDFGFSFMSEDDLVKEKTPTNHIASLRSTVIDLQAQIDEAWYILDPFLTKLQDNPEQDYIKWPGRAKKVAALQMKLKGTLKPSKKEGDK